MSKKTSAYARKRKNLEGTYVSSPLFKLTPAHSSSIKSSIRISFSAMKNNNFNQRHWIDLLTRMTVGEIIINEHYDEVSALEFKPCVEALVEIEKRAAENDHVKWYATKDELDTLEAGLDAVDQIQDENTRLIFLNAHRDADIKINKQYIHRSNIFEGTPECKVIR